MPMPNEWDKEVAARIAPDLARGMKTYDEYVARGEVMGTLARGYKRKWDELIACLAAYREEIEARAPEQATELQKAIEGLLDSASRNVGGMVPGAVAGWCRYALALLERGSAEPAEESCPACGGSGWTMEAVPAPPDGHPEPMQCQCEECGGTGTRPAEERGPEVGDVVMYRNTPNGQWRLWEYAACGSGIAEYVVLMRRGEVEARLESKSKEEER